MYYPIKRMRRLRASKIIRDSLNEIRLSKEQFIYPLFLIPGENKKSPITSLPGLYHFSPDTIVNEVQEALDLGINKFLIFGGTEKERKDNTGKEAFNPEGVVPKALKNIKKEFGEEVVLFADVCLCPYTSHGHCGIVDYEKGKILNDPTLLNLAQAALTYAEHGADWIAPSDMMDGRVKVIREVLDKEGMEDIAILSYSVKYASAYYGPFREAVDSAPQFGDRSTYQMDFRNVRQALQEILLDEQEGADAVMVKPALAYLDIIQRVRQKTNLPIAAYNVSGEYAMVKFGAQHGIFDEEKITIENLTAIARAGADWIITYHAKEVLEKGWL